MMAAFLLDRQLAKMVVASYQLNCSSEILSISAMLAETTHAWLYLDVDSFFDSFVL